MIKIAITDDHPMVISGISNMLSLYDHIQIIGKYGNGEALLAGLEKAQPDAMPDVLLLDIQLPDKTGNELMRIISRQYPNVRVLAITSMDTPYHIKDMLKNGCLGYVLKQVEHETLLHAIGSLCGQPVSGTGDERGAVPDHAPD
jgi:DNA-binding NarL/FixJ family response regulator